MSRARRNSPRRAWTVLGMLALVGVLVGGGIALYPFLGSAKSAHPAPVAGGLPASAAPAAPTAAPSRPAAPVSPAAALPDPPAGVLFDDFHYTGANDPALAAHGWQARTDGGGPGIKDTWSADGISFPAEQTAQGGQVLRLRAGTDGTKAGTRQAELFSSDSAVFDGTIAARVFLSDQPVSGPNGDHINESFYPISASDTSADYSELDYEYMPNGGWDVKSPELDTTSWYSTDDRVTRPQRGQHLGGWHTMVITFMNGKVTYAMDGKELFTSGGKYVPREHMGVHFNAWFIDLPFAGQRTWDMKVNWFYYQAGKAVPTAEVQKAVDGFYGLGVNYVDTVG
ncbi:glycoside hydrolase family 16 protein [Kitasatospora sp. LaBMicrA B282]|uniref:glycoside hydrolase family 16 protein n=1 Tax=Kitasatospora sp. LaBMicrA B282 TaxID=3420949 RepID=UPI003D10E412